MPQEPPLVVSPCDLFILTFSIKAKFIIHTANCLPPIAQALKAILAWVFMRGVGQTVGVKHLIVCLRNIKKTIGRRSLLSSGGMWRVPLTSALFNCCDSARCKVVDEDSDASFMIISRPVWVFSTVRVSCLRVWKKVSVLFWWTQSLSSDLKIPCEIINCMWNGIVLSTGPRD